MPPETRYANSGGLHIAYQVVGDGRFDLVYVPGWISNAELMWEDPAHAHLLRRLASFSRVIIFDKRGTGLSDPVPLDRLPTLEDADGRRPRGHGRRRLRAGRGLRLVGGRSHERSLRRDLSAADISTLAPHADEAFTQRTLAYFRRSASPGAAVALLRMNTQIDVRSVLPTIRVPTLIVHRTDDRDVNVEESRWIAAQIQGAKYVELPGDDHLVWAGNVDELIDEVEEFLTGTRRQSEPDRVLATLLFTDIVGSTQRAVELGDRQWRELLDHHNAVVRRELERFHGREIDTAGDGFLAVFDGPARAIRCGSAVRDGVRRLGLELRAGVHTGEVELADGAVRGIAVHTGARVAGAALPGEVLASQTVKDLVAGSGIQFEDRGAHELKGVPGEWRLYAVRSA